MSFVILKHIPVRNLAPLTTRLLLFLLLKRYAMQGREREIDTLSVRRPQPTLPTYRRKEEKMKIVEDKKGESN